MKIKNCKKCGVEGVLPENQKEFDEIDRASNLLLNDETICEYCKKKLK